MENYPESEAEEFWTPDEEEDILCSIVLVEQPPAPWWCGYARFKENPLEVPKDFGRYGNESKGIVPYIPVHGGVTYLQRDSEAVVFGFDCNHAGDRKDPKTSDPQWVKNEVERLAAGVREAAVFEEEFLSAETEEEKAHTLDAYHDCLEDLEGITFNLQNNFGAMLKALSGNL